ncbi:MAG: c-type cytochrome [Betaproteobacteria bacterium]|nr:c-type cytochrome [Betaproteobacteria bacterium]MDH3436891.1 c-type cytochrome [Betaproteobacteria bacterium]
MPKRLIVVVTTTVLSLAASVMPPAASAQIDGRSGKQVVDEVCAACHATGATGAPRIGNKDAWAPLASRGLTSLTESALKGIRNMPSHGGNPGLSDLEIERAITYMVNRSGGEWIEPIGGVTPALERKGKQVVELQCAKCHETGVFGAPKIGDRTAWILRLRRGLDFLVRSAINGHGPMPPRGGMAELTDLELRAAILHMFNPAGTATEPAQAAPIAAHDPNRKVADGMEIYLGIVSAETLGERYAKDDPERMIHGGIPRGRGYYHLNISLFDSKTRLAIANAEVTASVTEPVWGGETKELELVSLKGAKSYGNYFRMTGKNSYRIVVRVQRPGGSREIQTEFEFKP